MTHPEPPSVATVLEQASAGLLWMSESEYPFEVFVWDTEELTPAQLLARTDHPEGTALQITDLDTFFAEATRAQDWHGPEEEATVGRYRQLVQTLQANLTDLQVYRVGEVECAVYIVGKTPEGTLAGLATKMVET
ncbi:nuclease A inhibitor family protein [Anthocerotibacter panamensis]|uniref:nuclease A inhibitor family protein n=1 Tax=Anthocerotibacter panamensis TaxID=2857077 RepID=UPI001C4026FB|nr:nuclease A inhibitor family protein [Anthocerotibacter panamensis]